MPFHKKPYVRRYRRRVRRYRRRVKKNFRPASTRGLNKPMIVPFKRVRQFSGDLRTMATDDGWIETTTVTQQALVKTHVFQMDQLPGTTDFPSLFKQYRLAAVRMEIIPASTNTNIPDPNTGTTQEGNTGLLLRVRPNQTGTILTASDTRDDWNQNMTVKKFRLPTHRKTVIYMKLNQLSYEYRGNPLLPPGNFSYGVRRPTWVETTDLGLDHYGIDARIEPLNGANISALYTYSPAFTFFYTYYFQCRMVK